MRARPGAVLASLLVSACWLEKIDAIIAKYDTEPPTTGESTSTGPTSGAVGSSETGASSTEESAPGTTAASDDSPSTGGTADATDDSTGPAAVCGNGMLEPGEQCDDDLWLCHDCRRDRLIFVSSEPLLAAGDIGGLVGSDYECRHRAALLDLPNFAHFRAWISTTEIDARDRLDHHDGRYVLVNGLVVAESWDELTSGTLQRPIDVTEESETLNAGVWTGTRPDGRAVPDSDHCGDWTSSSAFQYAFSGNSFESDEGWSLEPTLNPAGCIEQQALYCIEQMPP